MSPSNNELSPNCKTTLCINNKNGKRRRKKTSFIRISKNEENVTDDFYCKRKKSIKHSQVDINNAVVTAPTGCMMTRNKLKKQLTSIDNSELVETTVIEDKCSKIDNIRSKSKKVFTNEISSPCPGKQLDTYYKKRTPLLFESDSDPEIDYFQIKDSIKNEVEEISSCISYPDDRFFPAFDKNVAIKTYFNKKLYPINDNSDVQSLNTFKKINEEPSSLYNCVKTAHGSNQCKRIAQNYSKASKSLRVTGPTTSLQINSEGDEFIIVPESLIRQLKNEIEIEKKKSQSNIVKNSLISIFDEPKETILDESYDNINNILIIDLDSNNSTTISMDVIDLHSDDSTTISDNSSSDQSIENQHNSERNITSHLSQDQIEPNQYSHIVIKDETKNKPIDLDSSNSTTISVEIINLDSDNSTTISEEIINLSNIQTFKCDNSSSDQSIENQHNSEKNITSYLSLDQIEPNQYSHTLVKDEIKNKPKYYNSKGRYNCSLKNDNLSSTNDSYSTKNDLNSKCYCKNFRSFNKDVNKIFNSKIKHFAFNNNAKKLREKISREKHLEANILNMLITKEHKNIIQSSKHMPNFNSISINKKYEKCIDLKKNHHIKPEDTKTNAVGKINTNTTCILKVADSSKDERTIDCLSSAASIKMSNPILPKKNSFDDHMSFELCNEFNKTKSLNKSISSNLTTKENNSVSLKNSNGESILKSEINNRNLLKKNINPFITTQTSNSLQKSRIPGIIDSEKETNITPLFEPPQYKNLFDTSSTISSKAYQICPMLSHISENNNKEHVNNLFEIPIDDITFSLNNKSSDDDGNRKLIVSNSILPKKNSLDDCMSFEMCNEFYKIKSLNKSIISKNESLPNHIQNVLKEVYVDELFVSSCQHMEDSCNDDDQLKNVFFQTDECRKIPSDVKLVCDIINKNVSSANNKIMLVRDGRLEEHLKEHGLVLN